MTVGHWNKVIRVRFVYLGLFLVLVLLLVLTVVAGESRFMDRYGYNFVTEITIMIFTLAFVQRILDRQDRARRLRGSVGMLRKCGRGLERLAEAWGRLIKGALPASQYSPPVSHDELFTPHVTESIIDVDPRSVWIVETVEQLRSARETLAAALAANAGQIDPAYVELVDALVEDPFITQVEALASDAATDVRSWRVGMNTTRGYREAHFERLLRTIELHNRLAGEAGRVRGVIARPRTDLVGIQLAGDHDLRVPTEFAASWWWSEPAPQALVVGREQPSPAAR
ncbi:MAG: hypothetical protein ACRELD_07400 [Longimicrobiales bacterium]